MKTRRYLYGLINNYVHKFTFYTIRNVGSTDKMLSIKTNKTKTVKGMLKMSKYLLVTVMLRDLFTSQCLLQRQSGLVILNNRKLGNLRQNFLKKVANFEEKLVLRGRFFVKYAVSCHSLSRTFPDSPTVGSDFNFLKYEPLISYRRRRASTKTLALNFYCYLYRVSSLHSSTLESRVRGELTSVNIVFHQNTA